MRIVKSVLAGALVLAAMLSAAAAVPAAAASKTRALPASMTVATPKVGISLDTNRASRAVLRNEIARQLMAKGLKLSSAELNQAVNTATDKLSSAGNGPQKGIIHLKFRRFTICISWGADKGHC